MRTAHAWIAIALAAPASAWAQVQPPPGPVPTVEAARIDDFEPRFAPGVDEGAGPPAPPPFQEILPSAMPWPEDGQFLGLDGPRIAHFKDLRTGEEYEIPMPAAPSGGVGGQGGGYAGPDGGGIDDLARSFGTMTEINTVDLHPWRMNCKLIMRFVDLNGNDRYFVCSGSMIDAETVMTAGHCVYARDVTGTDIFDWAEEIWVIPGWDGNGTTIPIDSRLEPYGWGYASGLASWTGWTQNGNFDQDVGLIRITRGVGMLTGWFGWAWGFDCGTIQGRVYNNTSYPSEACGSPGLHNGRDMYYWSGTVDSCPGNQLRLDTTPGCFTAVWGGMSGSGMYYIDGGNRFTHAVCSTSDRAFVGNYCKFWEDWIDYMNNTFIPGSRGSSFDLQALDTNIGDSTVTAGDVLATASFFSTNPTNANPPSNTYTFRVYLSTNDLISTGDTLLGTLSYSWDYGAMSSVTVNFGGAVQIPANTPSGSYFIGVILDSATDGDSSNNNTEGWDSEPISVTGRPDLAVTTVAATNGPLSTGDDITFNYTVRNNGSVTSSAYTVSFRASTNTTITTSDFELGSIGWTGLGAGSSRNDVRTFTLPVGLSPGTYYMGVIVTPSVNNDYDATNNTGLDPVPVVVNGRPDLTAAALNAANGTYSVCDGIPVSFTVRNIGNAASGPYSVDVRISPNTTITTADPLMATFNLPSLAAGGSTSPNVMAPVPDTLASGNWYVGMIVNGTNELSTANNTTLDSTPVGITGCYADFNCDGALTAADFSAFRTAFLAGDAAADCDHSGGLTPADFSCFRSGFLAGCP